MAFWDCLRNGQNMNQPLALDQSSDLVIMQHCVIQNDI